MVEADKLSGLVEQIPAPEYARCPSLSSAAVKQVLQGFVSDLR